MQEANARRIARENARIRSDWYSLLQLHQDELPALFDALTTTPSANASAADSAFDANDDLVSLAEVSTVFNAKGDAWGFIGVGGMRMGTTMLLDLRLHAAVVHAEALAGHSGAVAAAKRMSSLSDSSVSRNDMNAAVAAFANRRLTGLRRLRIASWYVTHAAPVAADAATGSSVAQPAAAPPSGAVVLRGRAIVLEEFDRLAAGIEHERRDAARAAAAAVRAAEEAALAAAAAEQSAKAAESGGHDKHAAAGQFAGLFKQVGILFGGSCGA